VRALALAVVLTVAAGSAAAQTAPAAAPAAAPFYASSWALVIGINAYQKARPALNYAVADARAVAAALPALGFPRENIRVLLDGDATRARIETVLYRDFARMGPDDRLLVYFAGHGETLPIRGGEEGYLLPVDADPQALPLTAIPMDEMRRIGQRLRAKHTLFVMDACFSGFALTRDIVPGPASDDALTAALREPVVQVLAAGRKGERALEEGGHGLFTRRVLDGLRLLPEADPRGIVTATRLAQWVEERVIRDSRGRMTPQHGRLDGEGQFVFVKPGALAEPRRERPRPTISREVVRESGALAIRARVGGVEVWLDEHKIGETEPGIALVLDNVEVGVHRLRGRKAGHRDWERQVTIVANRRAEVVIDFDTTPPPPAPETAGEAQRRWQGSVWLQVQKLGEQRARCAAEAERARLARDGAARAGKAREADLYARKLADKTACVTFTDQEILKLKALLARAPAEGAGSELTLEERYERDLALLFAALQRVNLWLDDPEVVPYDAFVEQMDALGRDLDGFRARYARVYIAATQRFADTLVEASKALVASAAAWRRETVAQREAERRTTAEDPKGGRPPVGVPAPERAAREPSRALGATFELRDAARKERLGHWDTARRLVREAAALAPPQFSSLGR
jgi:hypothetical protein